MRRNTENFMHLRYTIHETHTNIGNDRSDAVLHDASTAPMYYDGSDLIIPLPDGFIVSPNACCNETGRFLQTGAGEIRLKNAECLTEFVPFDQTYDILSHKYDPETSTYGLLLNSDFSRRARFVEFRCDSIEYGFNEYDGDSWIQDSRDHDEWRKTWAKPLNRYIRQGHGAAIRLLRTMPEIPKHWFSPSSRGGFSVDVLYRDMRRYAHNADRIDYIFDLLDCLTPESRESMISNVVCSFPQVTAGERNTCNFRQYANILERLAKREENSMASVALHWMYGELRRKTLDSDVDEDDTPENLASRYIIIANILGQPTEPGLAFHPGTPQDSDEPDDTAELYERAVAANSDDLLYQIYNTTCDSDLRKKAVKLLYNHGKFTDEMRADCMYDCDPVIRQLAGLSDNPEFEAFIGDILQYAVTMFLPDLSERLEKQVEHLEVLSTVFTGVGFHRYFRVHTANCAVTELPMIDLPGIRFECSSRDPDDIAPDFGLILWLEDGYISSLECYPYHSFFMNFPHKMLPYSFYG